MKVLSRHADILTLELPVKETRIIIASLREADQELEDWEFQTRTGCERSAMRELHNAIHNALYGAEE
ncbi:hypothetical protein ACTMTI_35755 [Nonomuraea sp. H19]|uniref:hypothetical protein n=1 Tax=Nonomuraea sp. H19 TaxID=3452206 RepID=UPI003F8CD1F7